MSEHVEASTDEKQNQPLSPPPSCHGAALSLFEDQWSEPREGAGHRALVFHRERLTHWLLRAGAEPRFFFLFCSGPAALSVLEEHLQREGITHSAHEFLGSTLPQALLEHRGDHFNRHLYLLLPAQAPLSLAQTLAPRLKQLRRAATWVALVVDSPAYLSALWEEAPMIARGAQRRALILDPVELTHTPQFSATPLPQEAPPADQLFESWATITRAPNAGEYGRLIRAGYGAPPSSPDLAAARRRLWAIHQRSELNAEQRAALGSDEIAAIGRHRRAILDVLPAGERSALKERWLDPLTRADGPLQGVSIEARRATIWLRECALGESHGDAVAIRAAVAVLDNAPPPLQIGLLWGAEAAAALGAEGFELCLELLLELWERRSAPGELRFAGGRRALEILLALHRRQEARRLSDALEHLANALHSPLFVAEALEGKAALARAIDPSAAEAAETEAATLRELHGFPRGES